MNKMVLKSAIGCGRRRLGLRSGCWPPRPAASELTVVSWGGAYTKSQVKAYHEPYTAEDRHHHPLG